ncbi:MAG: nitrilase-related carbon-nitrogen hydrolase [Thermoplasmata archaeon]
MVRIAVAQMQSSDNIDENISKSMSLHAKAEEGSADLIAYPEYQLYLADYSKRDDAYLAGKKIRNILPGFLDSLRVPALINYPELYGDRIYNTSAFVRDSKIQWKYRKIHLFNAYTRREGDVFSAGRKLQPGGLMNDVKFSTLICYDLRFPELSRYFAISGGELLIYQAGWFSGENKADQWLTLLKATAIQNGLYVAGAGQTGPKFTGNSVIFDPDGRMIAHEREREGVIFADVSKDSVMRYRNDSALLSARRDDVYSLRMHIN